MERLYYKAVEERDALRAEVDRLRRAINEIALRTSPYRDQWDEWPLVAGIAQVAQDAGGNAYVGEQQTKHES